MLLAVDQRLTEGDTGVIRMGVAQELRVECSKYAHRGDLLHPAAIQVHPTPRVSPHMWHPTCGTPHVTPHIRRGSF